MGYRKPRMSEKRAATTGRARTRRWWAGPACSAPAWILVGLLVWPDRVYRLDLLSHFVPQFGAALLLLGLLLGVPRWGRACALWVGLAGCALFGWHFGACSPPVAAMGARTIKVVQFNAHAEQSANDGAFHAWLKAQDADLVCLIETPWSFASANPWVRERYPYRVEPSMGLAWPNLLLSKFPLELTEMEADKPEHTFSFVARRSVTVTLPPNPERAGAPARFVWTAMHPVSPRRESSWRKSLEETARDAGILRRFVDGRRASGKGVEVLVTGDFNAAPTGRLHQTFGRITGFTGWCPRFSGGTWPAQLPGWLSVPIDRVWTTPGPGLRVVSFEVGPRLASDHRPIVVEVEVATPAGVDSGISEPAGSDAR